MRKREGGRKGEEKVEGREIEGERGGEGEGERETYFWGFILIDSSRHHDGSN